MKKIAGLLNRYFGLLLVTGAVLFASCEIGLGEGVDMTPPSVRITSHDDNDSVGPTFRLYGVAEDNENVTKLTIDFEDADIHYQIMKNRFFGGKGDKITLCMDYSSKPGSQIADPWYTGDFVTAYNQIEEGCRGLIKEIRQKNRI